MVLSIGYFDNDIFEMSLFQNGQQIVGHVSGEVDSFGLKKEIGNIELIKSCLDIKTSEFELARILKMKDLEEKVNGLERIIGISLWLKADWFDSFNNELKSRKVADSRCRLME